MTSFAAAANTTSTDPYKVLQLARNATAEQIRRAYKKACLRHHPDKHPAGPARVEAERTFKHIAVAYAKLTDAAPKKPIPPSPTRPFASEDIFGTRSSTPPTSKSASSTPASRSPRSRSYAQEEEPFSQADYRPRDREVDLPLTLEELASGCVKRRKVRMAGVSDAHLPTLTIAIKPGYRPGDRVRFRSAWTPPGSKQPADVVFVLSQKRHATFVLDGDDLRLTMRLNLVDALTGALLVVRTLDASPLNLLLDPVISPKHVERVKGHGMPRRSDASKNGDLLVSFDIEFPKHVDAEHRPGLRDIFAKFDKDAKARRHIRRSSSLFVNPQMHNHRRASTTDPSNGLDSQANLKKERRDERTANAQQPQSKTRRRFAAIFR